MGAWIETARPAVRAVTLQSHPVWVRGLKLWLNVLCFGDRLSHPVWVRGLKLAGRGRFGRHGIVAPRVGAWIETPSCITCFIGTAVAPRVGAWIETISMRRNACHLHVAPRVGAWIETNIRHEKPKLLHVAPRVGAWIETISMRRNACHLQSHPVWVRGLKPADRRW